MKGMEREADVEHVRAVLLGEYGGKLGAWMDQPRVPVDKVH
jgi:hypothetical protein